MPRGHAKPKASSGSSRRRRPSCEIDIQLPSGQLYDERLEIVIPYLCVNEGAPSDDGWVLMPDMQTRRTFHRWPNGSWKNVLYFVGADDTGAFTARAVSKEKLPKQEGRVEFHVLVGMDHLVRRFATAEEAMSVIDNPRLAAAWSSGCLSWLPNDPAYDLHDFWWATTWRRWGVTHVDEAWRRDYQGGGKNAKVLVLHKAHEWGVVDIGGDRKNLGIFYDRDAAFAAADAYIASLP